MQSKTGRVSRSPVSAGLVTALALAALACLQTGCAIQVVRPPETPPTVTASPQAPAPSPVPPASPAPGASPAPAPAPAPSATPSPPAPGAVDPNPQGRITVVRPIEVLGEAYDVANPDAIVQVQLSVQKKGSPLPFIVAMLRPANLPGTGMPGITRPGHAFAILGPFTPVIESGDTVIVGVSAGEGASLKIVQLTAAVP